MLKGGGKLPPLLLETSGGNQKVNCADTEGILRIVQSMPSLKAEPTNVQEQLAGIVLFEEAKSLANLSTLQKSTGHLIFMCFIGTDVA